MHHRKLGRLPGVRHPDLPRMSAFLNSQVRLPPLPEKQDWFSAVAQWPVLKNDQLSDCTIATVGHVIQQESIYAGAAAPYHGATGLIMSDDEAVAGYEKVGYVPGRPETDQGAYEGDVVRIWMQQGFMCGGQLDKIVGFADMNPHDLNQLKYSIFLTGNAFLGFELPACAETNPIWDLPRSAADAQILGGHAVPAVGWDTNYVYVVSWGTFVPVTWQFYIRYIMEAHTTLSKRWINTKGLTPSGVDWSTLVSDTKAFCARVSA